MIEESVKDGGFSYREEFQYDPVALGFLSSEPLKFRQFKASFQKSFLFLCSLTICKISIKKWLSNDIPYMDKSH